MIIAKKLDEAVNVGLNKAQLDYSMQFKGFTDLVKIMQGTKNYVLKTAVKAQGATFVEIALAKEPSMGEIAAPRIMFNSKTKSFYMDLIGKYGNFDGREAEIFGKRLLEVSTLFNKLSAVNVNDLPDSETLYSLR